MVVIKTDHTNSPKGWHLLTKRFLFFAHLLIKPLQQLKVPPLKIFLHNEVR